jgi:predicted nicotinamide N-methyase
MASSSATVPEMLVDISYAAPQAHRIINATLHQEYSPGIIFIFSQGRKYLYHV